MDQLQKHTSSILIAVAAVGVSSLVSYSVVSSMFQRKVKALEGAVKSERDGRIKMQIQLGAAEAKLKNVSSGDSANAASAADPILPVTIIGHITSPYSTRYSYMNYDRILFILRIWHIYRNGTPRQPSLVPASRARLTLHKNIPKSSLQSLSEFSHAWIIFHFHQNTNGASLFVFCFCGVANKFTVHKSQFKGTIKPPRLNGASVGVFSTRTPHRPAPVGLSLGRVVEVNVDKGYVVFQGLDLVHGTPVLDIKPYVAFSDAPSSLLIQDYNTPSTNHYAPSWVTKEVEDAEPLSVDSVSFSDDAKSQIDNVFKRVQKKSKATSGISLYPTVNSFIQFVVDNLMLDFRSTRERTDPKLTQYRVTLCDIVVHYHFAEGASTRVVVTGAETVRDELAQPLNII
ncbi:UNVERIFIED_CONTAM: hypothetical protein HDU68_001822 [Siphonaria sp. JEL0065]|nr:hypothetical protein HDU68_001822 [Siphonaria sp. JEL0065]